MPPVKSAIHVLHMKKLILASGIFVVFLLEVGFGVYVAFERRFESALMARNQIVVDSDPAAAIENELADLSAASDNNETLADTEDQSMEIDVGEISPINSRSAEIKKITRTVAGRNQKRKANLNLLAAKKVLTTTRIEPVRIAYRIGTPFEFTTKSEYKPTMPDTPRTASYKGRFPSRLQNS